VAKQSLQAGAKQFFSFFASELKHEDMKHFFLVVALLSLGNFSFAQTDSSKTAWGLAGSADYCHRLIYKSNNDPAIVQLYNYFSENEIAAIGYSAGLSASIPLTYGFKDGKGKKYASLDISLLLAERVYESKPSQLTNINGVSIGEVYFTYANKFISLPIGIHKKIHNIGKSGKTAFWLGGSIIPEYFLGLWTKSNFNIPTAIDMVTREDMTYFRTFQASASLDMGIRKTFGKIRLELTPNAKIALLKQAKNTPINRRLWSAGLEFRLLYAI
jgi:hypothetical protein